MEQEKRHKKKQKENKYLKWLRVLIWVAILLVVFIFIKSDYAEGVLSLRKEAVAAVRNSTLEDRQGESGGSSYEAEGNLSFLHTYVNYLKELGEYLIQFILYTLPFVAITGITITIVFVIRKKRNK